jgi:hypothetical protein
MAEMDIPNTKLRETRDRLVLLLISLSREGWVHEFRQITPREIHRLASPDEAGHHEWS